MTEHVFQLDFAARVDRGLVRDTNQDVARVIPRLGLALVADGMGGHNHGEVASRTAADLCEQSFAGLGRPGAHIDETAEHLQRCFRAANERLAAHPTTGKGRAKMGTTLVAVAFAHGRAVIAHVGDSRCYRLRSRTLALLTQDHSYAAHLEQIGAAATPEGREAAGQWAHVLTRCINGEEGVTADVRIVGCEPGDVYLLCSDGLWGSVAEHAISAILGASQDAEEACQRLISAAWAGGGLDNIGVAVVRLLPQQLRLDEPSWLERPDRASDQPPGCV